MSIKPALERQLRPAVLPVDGSMAKREAICAKMSVCSSFRTIRIGRASRPAVHGFYNVRVARGWESKSVEAQQAEATAEKPGPRARLTPGQVAKHQKLEGLLLSRKNVTHLIEASANARYRKLLEQALHDLDSKIAQFAETQEL